MPRIVGVKISKPKGQAPQIKVASRPLPVMAANALPSMSGKNAAAGGAAAAADDGTQAFRRGGRVSAAKGPRGKVIKVKK